MSSDMTGKDFATRQIHAGAIRLEGISPLSTPIFQTSTFVFDNAAQGAARFAGEESGYIYTRLGNPNANRAAIKIASLENAEAALVLASGMGAITTVLWTLLKAGDHVLADETLYGCTFALMCHGLPRYGVETTFIDFSDPQLLRDSLRENTKVVYFETPSNPNMKILDLEEVARIAHEYNPEIQVIVDNTFATPYLQRPLDLGCDIVVHSATKYLNGHGDVIAGAIAGKAELMEECTFFGLKDMTGAVISPFDAFLLERGMKTLDIRMEKHCASAMKIAQYLSEHDRVRKVYYPGLPSHPRYDVAKRQMKLPGGMISFELDGDLDMGERFVNSLDLCTLAVSLGDAETLIEHPASMTHSTYCEDELMKAKISTSLIRLSVGLEGVDDIIEDLDIGLRKL